jgi:F0F1-type ATP synthase assembly protein I
VPSSQDPQEPAGTRREPTAATPEPAGHGPPSALDLMTLGLTMALLVGGGLGLGLLVDDWLGSSPIATLVGLGLGVVLAGAALWQRARQAL